MGMITCKECGKEVSDKAGKCINCGCPIMSEITKKAVETLLTIAVISFVIIFCLIITDSKGTTRKKSNTPAYSETHQEESQQPLIMIKDTVTTDKFEITILNVEKRTFVGGEYFKTSPSSGGVYVAVKWEYKNITDKPIKSYSSPKISLQDSNGVKYSQDYSASSYYATEINKDRKIISDLNPGIKVVDSSVFEISQESYNNAGWNLLVDSDMDYLVNIK